jgi:hypothetical protein
MDTFAQSELPLAAATTRADFWSGQFCISADVSTGDRRLLEVLRDASRQYVEVKNVRVNPTAPEQRIDSGEGLLSKSEINWVAVRAEPSRAEARLYGYVKKTPIRVTLVLASHVIQGNVFVEGTATDPVSYFLRGIEKSNERFLAVGSATTTHSDGCTEQVGLAIVNRSAVRLFSVVR